VLRTQNPDPYLLITAKTGWATLQQFWSKQPVQLYTDWDNTIQSYHPNLHSYMSSTL